MKTSFIYTPPQTTIENVDLDFPWLGKIWKVKKIPYRSCVKEKTLKK